MSEGNTEVSFEGVTITTTGDDAAAMLATICSHQQLMADKQFAFYTEMGIGLMARIDRALDLAVKRGELNLEFAAKSNDLMIERLALENKKAEGDLRMQALREKSESLSNEGEALRRAGEAALAELVLEVKRNDLEAAQALAETELDNAKATVALTHAVAAKLESATSVTKTTDYSNKPKFEFSFAPSNGV